MYNHIFFDLDRTLWDFEKNSHEVLTELYQKYDLINRGITDELDSNFTDYELLEIWNPIYEKYGFLLPEFKDKWENKHLKEDSNSIKTSNVEMFESKINELEFRIKQLENKLLKNKYIEGMG